jgi:hypothetical protein
MNSVLDVCMREPIHRNDGFGWNQRDFVDMLLSRIDAPAVDVATFFDRVWGKRKLKWIWHHKILAQKFAMCLRDVGRAHEALLVVDLFLSLQGGKHADDNHLLHTLASELRLTAVGSRIVDLSGRPLSSHYITLPHLSPNA